MEDHQTYDQEIVDDLYAQLQESDSLLPDYRRAYLLLNRVLQQCLNHYTDFSGVRFGGPFAKTDYLLKEYHASQQLQRSVHDARVRMRNISQLTASDVEVDYRYDFKAICQLVELVSGTPVPESLAAHFPANRIRKQAVMKADYLRIIVDRWDDTFLYGHADAEDTGEITVFYGGKSNVATYHDWDWSYLRELLCEGCQLNIIRPREQDGVCYPELVVWEPDYLIDISAVAACFENYAASAVNHLLGKLKPMTATQHTLLGNLAGQLLDESLYLLPNDQPYNESARRFFKDNALHLLTTELSGDFHAKARVQKQHIREVLGCTLPQLLRNDGMHFDASEMMVEPSFFSEMLGLQGRMDLLQLDGMAVVEQKAGKGGFPESDPPKMLEKHYVQLLLYMLLIRYNFHDRYRKNGNRLFAFLLYSKYQNGLLPLGFAPDLVFAAMKLRNEIAANEYDYCRNGLDILTRLTADSLNMNHVEGVLWEQYQKPQIDALLSPIRTASPLERAYYLRFLKFISTEHLLSKVGSQTKENSGFANKWYCSLEDKLTAGNICYNLELRSPSADEKERTERVVLGITAKKDYEVSNFRNGDIVILYSYPDGEEPDARRTIVFRATIEHITADTITLGLRAAQVNGSLFWYHGNRKWAIEHDFFESSSASLFRGMHALLAAPKERRDLLLLQRPPKTDKTKTLQGDYGDFNELALKVKQAEELFLIIGPPGTGKTSYGLLTTLQEELASTTDSVLLLAYTNRAVDEICGKLTDSGIDFIRIGSKFSCEEAYRPYLLDAKANQCVHISQLHDLIGKTRVFTGTTASLTTHLSLFNLKSFSLAIIDEASQILEPQLMGLLSATTADGSCAIRKVVLIGDHKQLPAVVQQKEEESAVTDPMLHAIHLTNCRLSLFERLLKQYRYQADVTYMLTRQGRMHHDIAQFPNEAFYQGKLCEVPLQHQCATLPESCEGEHGIDEILQTRRIAFVAIPATERRTSDVVNSHEAIAIAATVARIYALNKEHFSPLQTVGVIVPYRNQIAEIRHHLTTYGIPVLNDITIDTVERYQGSQRDYIIYGFTIQRHYQLTFLTANEFSEEGAVIDRKLNVAMTRAREHLLLFGNPTLLASDPVFRRLLDFTKSRQSYFSFRGLEIPEIPEEVKECPSAVTAT